MTPACGGSQLLSRTRSSAELNFIASGSCGDCGSRGVINDPAHPVIGANMRDVKASTHAFLPLIDRRLSARAFMSTEGFDRRQVRNGAGCQ
jgi:hypothetical protein